DRQLSARREDAFLRRIVRPEVRRVPLDNRLAHLGHAGHRRVAREVLLDRLDRRILNMLGRRKVRLARAKVRKINALRLHLQSLGGNGHRRRNFNAVNAVGQNLRGRCNCGCAHAFSLQICSCRKKRSRTVRLRFHFHYRESYWTGFVSQGINVTFGPLMLEQPCPAGPRPHPHQFSVASTLPLAFRFCTPTWFPFRLFKCSASRAPLFTPTSTLSSSIVLPEITRPVIGVVPSTEIPVGPVVPTSESAPFPEI